jgi:hypothetical protein
MVAEAGSRLEMDCGRKGISKDGSPTEVIRGLIWIITGYGSLTEMDESRSMTGDGSREMDDNQAVSRL